MGYRVPVPPPACHRYGHFDPGMSNNISIGDLGNEVGLETLIQDKVQPSQTSSLAGHTFFPTLQKWV